MKKVFFLHVACMVLVRMELKSYMLKVENFHRTMVKFVSTFKNDKHSKDLSCINLGSIEARTFCACHAQNVLAFIEPLNSVI